MTSHYNTPDPFKLLFTLAHNKPGPFCSSHSQLHITLPWLFYGRSCIKAAKSTLKEMFIKGLFNVSAVFKNWRKGYASTWRRGIWLGASSHPTHPLFKIIILFLLTLFILKEIYLFISFPMNYWCFEKEIFTLIIQMARYELAVNSKIIGLPFVK